MTYVSSNLVNITFVHSRVKDGVLVEDVGVRAAADATLDELLMVDGTLSSLRRAS